MTVSREDLHRAAFIAPPPDYTHDIGLLVAMMHYVRLTTIQAVGGLNGSQLDTIPQGFANSIGMLLAHIAAVDRLYQCLSFKNRGFDDEEWAHHAGAFSFGREGERVQGLSLEHHLENLKAARIATLSELARRDDAWLASSLVVPGIEHSNHHWAWFHVLEDEVSHRGQIRILRKALETWAR